MRLTRLVGAVVFATLFSACSSSGPTSEEPEATPPSSSDSPSIAIPDENRRAQVLVRTGSPGGGSDALVSGTLTASGSCLGVKVEDVSYPVVFPTGTTSSGEAIELPNGEELSLGDQVSLGGGFYSAPLPSGIPPIPEDCLGPTGEIVVLNAPA